MILKGKLNFDLNLYDVDSFKKALDEFNERHFKESSFVEFILIKEYLNRVENEKFGVTGIRLDDVIGKIKNFPLKLIEKDVLVEIELYDTPKASILRGIISELNKKIIPYQICMKGTGVLKDKKWYDVFIGSLMIANKNKEKRSKYDIEVIL